MAKKAELMIVIDAEGGEVPINLFVTVLNNTIGVLRGLAGALDQEGDTAVVNWAITNVTMRSPLTLTISGHTKRRPAFANRVIREYIGGFRSMQLPKKQCLPRNFHDKELDSVQNIVGVLNAGINTIAFESPEYGKVTPTMHLTANIQRLRQRGYYSEFTTFCGKLFDIRTSDGLHEFIIQDEATSRKITCVFPPNEVDRVGNGFLQKRIEVYGKARFSDKGIPISIEISDFEKTTAPKYPRISAAPPMRITGGIDPVDYVRKIRNGERM